MGFIFHIGGSVCIKELTSSWNQGLNEKREEKRKKEGLRSSFYF
jgi:hypothetical protein